jgi:proline iminopeptidase
VGTRSLVDSWLFKERGKAQQMTMVAARGISLFTRVVGRGRPLLLMHGGPGVDHTTLLPLRALAQTHTLVFYDHRCNGRSARPEICTMTWENLVADADALRQALGFEEWAVLGHSFGGMVALEYALHYPDRLTHLILVDTCADTWWVHTHAPELLEKRGYSPQAVTAARQVFNGEVTSWQIKTALLRFGRAYTYRLTPRSIISLLRIKSNPEATRFAFGHLLPGWNVMHRLGEIRVPTLVMAGRHDFEFPPEHQAIIADRLPDARLEIIEKAGHNAPMERSKDVVRVVENFLSHASQQSR